MTYHDFDISTTLTKDLQARYFLSLSDAAKILGCSKRTLQRKVAEGRFLEPKRKVKSKRIHGWFKDELLEYISKAKYL